MPMSMSRAGAGARNGNGDGVDSRNGGLATRLALAAVCASLSESATFPLDTLKTRLQLLRSGSASASSSSSSSANAIPILLAPKTGTGTGKASLYSGLSPAILRHLLYTPIRIVTYETLRGLDAHAPSSPSLSLFLNALAGGASGVFAQVVASPADLIKVRMQANPSLYTGTYDAFSKIIQSQGFFALWRGVAPNAQRAFLVNMGELTCYDHAKHFILTHNICHDNIFAHTLSSLSSGLCATLISCPADVVKTRMMNTEAVAGPSYRSSLDCLLRTVRDEGIRALWKGFFPTWARLGPWQLVFWVSYEKLRQIVGLSSF